MPHGLRVFHQFAVDLGFQVHRWLILVVTQSQFDLIPIVGGVQAATDIFCVAHLLSPLLAASIIAARAGFSLQAILA